MSSNNSIAFIWDFDGVIVFTPHYEAWSITCRDYGIEGFTREFYDAYVSGRPRLEGGRIILEKLGAFGKVSPDKREALLREFTEYKNKVFHRLVKEGRYEVNWDVVLFILRAKSMGILQVLASASRNAKWIVENTVLEPGIRLSSLFDVNVSGIGLSKDEVFSRALKAISRISGVVVKDCIVVFEDSLSGIIAAKKLGLKTVGYRLVKYSSGKIHPDIVLDSLREVNPISLVKSLGCKI